MYSIGQLSKMTGVKSSTIRYYEEMKLIRPRGRSEGNQRRYYDKELQKLSFIKHARDLGLSIDSIRKLIELNNHPEKNCKDANDIAESHLKLVKEKIKKLKKLEKELKRITAGCGSDVKVKECYVIKSLSDHELCGNKSH